MYPPPLFLASTSPRRRELLQQLGLAFSVLNVAVDESVREGERPGDYVVRLAREKAAAGLAALNEGVVVAADTSVVLDDQVLGKPASEVDAMAMWERLSGRMHRVLTGVAVGDGRHVEAVLVSTRVHFRPLSRTEMEAYWRSGEPADKAGGYAIQGLGAVFVDAIEGSYTNVVGLPLSETAALLARFGIRVLG
ncbi:MAG: Maf family protein [Gammaproteobacteria bacterium]